ncbi:tetratricopeptide repeat protein [Sphingomonas sp. NBWT7]|uniref:SPOR domain-containing protein n=1 Tax=Sphingomonas sp. NBWT7 TaxID=2596913 RepID=UPI00162A81B3|nr:SPOR domain-containing protein [Sphingomonas sp. NBWT7]QNE31425.1 tetratricopeptide repeat protein [Sphingomonas sp. NBWT7]
MKTNTLVGLSLSALMLGGTMVGCANGGLASASSRSDSALARNAANNADKAAKAMAGGKAAKAIGFAEAAVAGMPQNADYRALLGAAYLKAGRFTSAHQAYADVLSLAPGNGKAALNLALAMIAEGQWDEARKTLDDHADTIPARDRGLAIALAGDPTGGVELLTAAARTPEADARTRQNLALVLALAGQWQVARSVAGVDMAPAAVDARIVEWAAFARPAGAADQVSALLGVVPVKDPGRPVALALNATVPVTAVAAVEPEAPAPEEAAPGMEMPVEVAAVAATPADMSGVSFATRREVVQPLPATAVAAARPAAAATSKAAPVQVAAVSADRASSSSARALAKGNWFVQLGAYESAGVAKDAWGRATRRYPAFAEQTPAGVTFKSFYRLSVGGFAKGDANALCRGYRATGGTCFVRTAAGDQVARWAAPAKVQMASR